MSEPEKQQAQSDIDRFHKFYSDAWGKLITMLPLTVLVLGLGVPVFLYIAQRQTFKDEAAQAKRELEQLRNELREEQRKGREEQRKEYESSKTELADRFGGYEANVTARVLAYEANTMVNLRDGVARTINELMLKPIGRLEAATMFQTGNFQASRGKYGEACQNYAAAASEYLLREDEVNYQNAVSNMVEDLAKTNKKEMTALRASGTAEETIRALIAQLEKANINGRYLNTISSIKTHLQEALERQPP
jgi:hypothetical protein